MIDDVTISTVPIVIGTGRRLFGGWPQTKTCTLASLSAFPAGSYRRIINRTEESTVPADFVGTTQA